MKLSEIALKEDGGVLLSLFFVRMVSFVSPYGKNERYAVLGVPPWRDLSYSDCSDKIVVQVK